MRGEITINKNLMKQIIPQKMIPKIKYISLQIFENLIKFTNHFKKPLIPPKKKK